MSQDDQNILPVARFAETCLGSTGALFTLQQLWYQTRLRARRRAEGSGSMSSEGESEKFHSRKDVCI